MPTKHLCDVVQISAKQHQAAFSSSFTQAMLTGEPAWCWEHGEVFAYRCEGQAFAGGGCRLKPAKAEHRVSCSHVQGFR